MKKRQFLFMTACALLAGCASAGRYPKAPDGPYATQYSMLQEEKFNVSYSAEVRGLRNSGAEKDWFSPDNLVAFLLNSDMTKAEAKRGRP